MMFAQVQIQGITDVQGHQAWADVYSYSFGSELNHNDIPGKPQTSARDSMRHLSFMLKDRNDAWLECVRAAMQGTNVAPAKFQYKTGGTIFVVVFTGRVFLQEQSRMIYLEADGARLERFVKPYLR